MAIMLLSFKKNSNGRIMFHGFLAANERDAKKDLEGYAGAGGETIDQEIEIDELPEFDEESIAEFCDDLFGLEGDGVDEDEEDEEEDEEEGAEV